MDYKNGANMDKEIALFLLWWVGGGLLIAVIITMLSSCSATYTGPISSPSVKPIPSYVYIVPKPRNS